MLKTFMRKRYIVWLAIIVQFIWLFILLTYLSDIFAPIAFIVQVISIIALLVIINKAENPAFKIPWVILIFTSPILGGIIYFLTSREGILDEQKKRYEWAEKQAKKEVSTDLGKNITSIEEKENTVYGQFQYLENKGFPVYQNTTLRYYEMADLAFEDLLKDLKEAKQYIFLEYFIINQNSMWLEILDILLEKAKQGVEIRVMYDDVATMAFLEKNYPNILIEKGIQCIAFNPLIPFCASEMNHRDHRKITSIDGKIAYTGGFNLSDEYINRAYPYGNCWKDIGIRLEGEAAWQMTLFFLTMWQSNTGKQEVIEKYKPFLTNTHTDGFVQPYTHAPFPTGRILGDVYQNIINQSTKYLYIYTPYFIPDPETIHAICLASKRGVDVRILLPGYPDKKIIDQMTKAHYKQLLDNGVKIYEYAQGFLHAKCILADDKIGSIGTGNMDNRSLYHSYENGCLLYENSILKDVYHDFVETMQECRQIQEAKNQRHVFANVYYAILRVFAPLL